MTRSMPASDKMPRSLRRTLFVVSGVWLRLKKIKCSGSSEATATSRSRNTSAAKLGTETVRVDLVVLGCAIAQFGSTRSINASAAAAIAMHAWIREYADLGADEAWRG